MAREVELRDPIDPEEIGISTGTTNWECSIDDGLEVEQIPLTAQEGQWAIVLLLSSGADLLLGSSTIAIVAFKYAYRDGGVSLVSIGFQALSHWFSSALLAQRLYTELRSRSTHVDQGLLRQRRRDVLYREQGLSVAMGLTMLISSCVILYKAFLKLKQWETWYLESDRRRMDQETERISEWLVWVGFAIYLVQALLRCCGWALVRLALVSHVAVVTIVSLLYLLVLGVAAAEEKEWSWKAEPIAAIVLVGMTLVEGIRIVYNYLDDMDSRVRRNDRA